MVECAVNKKRQNPQRPLRILSLEKRRGKMKKMNRKLFTNILTKKCEERKGKDIKIV
jgi:hypothetical protein